MGVEPGIELRGSGWRVASRCRSLSSPAGRAWTRRAGRIAIRWTNNYSTIKMQPQIPPLRPPRRTPVDDTSRGVLPDGKSFQQGIISISWHDGESPMPRRVHGPDAEDHVILRNRESDGD